MLLRSLGRGLLSRSGLSRTSALLGLSLGLIAFLGCDFLGTSGLLTLSIGIGRFTTISLLATSGLGLGLFLFSGRATVGAFGLLLLSSSLLGGSRLALSGGLLPIVLGFLKID